MTEAALPGVQAAEPPLPDPSPRLTAAFRQAAERMAGMGFVNPALEVEAVAFEPWQGHWLGVMVTPWFMNLVLLPRERSQWQPLPLRAKRKLRFPAGVYEFIGADDPLIGEHQTCSLFSPMNEFQDQAAARLVARLAREALFDAANAEVPEFPRADLLPQAPEAPEPAAAAPAAPVSKRDFLRGRLGGSSHVDRG
ncbi:MAG TPA: [NiFe]-hydrogenase assembly chaperone HybE [Rubrivivax sp.]|nr:[NiFe]-hydrogenase assembly chaperone HybE [Rubrivivax sp.]